jgi:C4-dicarboxylate-binding protein DctP
MNYFVRAVCVAPLLFSAFTFADCDKGELVIKFSHVSSAGGNPKGEAAQTIANRINQEMNGKACMQVYPKSQLFDDKEVLQALLLNDVQVASPSLSKFEAYTKRFRLFDLPFLFKDMQAVDTFVSGQYGQELLNAMSDKGLVGLSYIYSGFKQFSANKPLLVPADTKGLKFRANSSDVTISMIEAMGAAGQKLAFKEVFNALQLGIVDGQDNAWSNIYKARFHEVQDGITETNHKLLTYLAIASKAWLDGLPADIREQFLTIFKEETENANKRATQINLEAKQKIIASGVEVRVLTNEQRQLWEDAMQPVWDKYSDEIGQDVIDAAIAAGQ